MAPGDLFDLNSLSLDVGLFQQPSLRQGFVHVRSDADGFASDLDILPANSGSAVNHAVDLTALADLASVEFRFYPVHDPNDGNSLTARIFVDDVVLDGNQFTPDDGGNGEIPEPDSIAIWSLLGLGLAGIGYRRVRRKS